MDWENIYQVFTVGRDIVTTLLGVFLLGVALVQWATRRSGDDVKFIGMTAWLEKVDDVPTILVGLHWRDSFSISEIWRNIFDRAEVRFRLWRMCDKSEHLIGVQASLREAARLRTSLDFITNRLVRVLKGMHSDRVTILQEDNGTGRIDLPLRYVAAARPVPNADLAKLLCIDSKLEYWALVFSSVKESVNISFSRKAGMSGFSEEVQLAYLRQLQAIAGQVVHLAQDLKDGVRDGQADGPAVVRTTTLSIEAKEVK